MESVHPIRDIQQLKAMAEVLKADSPKYYVLFMVGINCGLKVTDLLNLKMGDVAEEKFNIRERIGIEQSRVGHYQYFPINCEARVAIQEYLQTQVYDADAPLFPSQKGGGPLKRFQAWKIINRAAQRVGITDPIGTQSLRKTFAYHAYISGRDIGEIQRILNHRSPEVTLKYIEMPANHESHGQGSEPLKG